MTDVKRCTKCDGVKPLTEFHRRRASRDGYQLRCKACMIVAVGPASRARSRAVTRLIAAHRADYDQLYAEELCREGVTIHPDDNHATEEP